MKLTIALLLTAVCWHTGDAFRILVVFPMPGRSHTILGDGVVRHLAAAGHDITYITPLPKKTQPKNVRQIDVSENFKYVPADKMSIRTMMEDGKMDLNFVFQMMLNIHNLTYHHPNVQELLSDTSLQFDVVIAEWMFSELYSAFAAVFNVPHIWVSTVEPHWAVLRLIDEACNPAYTTDAMTSSNHPFTFIERVKQLQNQIFTLGLTKLFVEPFEHNVYSSLTPFFELRGRDPPSFGELKFNASLMLGNSHVSLGQPMTLPQSYKAIGGYHIESKLAPLPEDLQKLMDNAKHGVIYFSLGSNIKSVDLPDEVKESLLKMFGELKQTVIWKFEEELPGLPDNVNIIKWAPQPSILAHPNCVLFITHGGLLSTTETIYYAKPIIGIPVFADQFTNVDRAVAKGFAKKVDLSMTMAGGLKAAIKDIVNNPVYLKKVKELSFIFHDRPVSPGAELVHWVEHVIKTKGAPHLRSPALDVPFYQKMYLDLLALIVAIVLAVRALFRRIFRKSPNKEKTQ